MSGRHGGTRGRRCARWAGASAVAVAALLGVGEPALGLASTSYFEGEMRIMTEEPCLNYALVELRLEWAGQVRWSDRNGDGTVDHLKLDMKGKVEMKPTTDATIPEYEGGFGVSLSQNTNGKTYSETYVVNSTLRGDDGSKLRIKQVAHVTSNANGDVTSKFDRPTCG